MSGYKQLIVCTLCVGLITLFCGSVSQAELRYDLHNDPVAHGALEGSGILDTLPGDIPVEGMVGIDDGSYKLAPDCIFRNQQGTMVDISSLQVGKVVGFYAVDSTITKMWVKEEQPVEERSSDISPASITGGGADNPDGLRLENGVWTN